MIFTIFRWSTDLYMSSICPSFCLSVCCTLYFRNRTLFDYYFWYTCVKWWYLRVFFSFFQNLVFWVHRGVKEQKMVQNNKKIQSVKFHISGTIHNMTVIYGATKNDPEWQNFLSVAPCISGTMHNMIFICGTHVCIKG